MKGFAANLTATRLEQMLAFYMTPEADNGDEASKNGRDSAIPSDKTSDLAGKRAAKAAALTEN